MNPIEIPVSELKAALPGLRQIIPRKTYLPILNCIRVCRLQSGRLTLQAADPVTSATYATQTRAGDESAEMLVPGDELAQALKGAAKDDCIQLVPDPQRPCLLHRVAGNWLEKPLPVFESNEWPPSIGVDSEPVSLPADLPQALKQSLDYAADEGRLDLHGAWLDVEDPKAHYVMACNGGQMFTANSFSFGLKESLLVPYHRFLQWDGFHADGPWQLRFKPKDKVTDAYLQLASEHWTFVTQVPEAKLRNWKASVPGQSLTRVRFSEDSVKALLELLPRLPSSDQTHHGVEFHFGEPLSTVTGRARDHHSTVELIGLKVEGQPLTIGVNRNYVIQALKLGLRGLELNDALSPLMFHHAGRRLLVMPLRMHREEPQPPAPSPTEPANEMPAPKPEPVNEPEAPGSPSPNPEPQPATPTSKSMSQTAPAKPPTTTEPPSALRQAITKLEGLKENVKGILTDLNEMLKVLHVAQKEQRAADREVEEVRAALEAIKKLRV
jgi:hypothetical protein